MGVRKSMKNIGEMFVVKTRIVISSKYFFYGIISIAVLQGLWYSFSFRPWIYDEYRHFETIQVYATHWSPFLSEQSFELDRLGELTRDSAFVYYYLMSFPLRIIELFTSNLDVQVITLRIVSLLVFILGIVIIRKALLEVRGFSPSIVHIALLLFVITPATGFLAGIINYDNFVLPVYGALLLLAVKMVKSRKLRIDYLSLFISLGLLSPLLKYSSLALFAPLAMYVAYDIYKNKRHELRRPGDLLERVKRYSILKRFALISLLLLSVVLFIERPVQNTILYGKPEPKCSSVMSVDRCNSFRDYKIYADLKANRDPNFKPVDYSQYITQYWLPIMSKTMTNLLEQGDKTQLPIAIRLYYLLVLLGIILVLVGLRALLQDNTRSLLLLGATVYIVVLIVKEYSEYVANGGVVAVRARYLAPVLPGLIAISIYCAKDIFRNYKPGITLFGLVVIVLLFQGSSLVTHIMKTPDSGYWNEARSTNKDVKKFLQPFIIESEHD